MTSTPPKLGLTPILARRLAIAKQRLTGPQPQPDTAGIMEIMRELGCLQLDPISAVARSHWLVLWSRLGPYDPAQLDQLLWQEQQLFEYWAHAASIVLLEDYPIHRMYMQQWPTGNSAWHRRIREWLAANDSFRRYVLAELRQRGPLPSSQLEDRSVAEWESGGWTTSQNVRQMLHFLWMQGQIMVVGRAGQARLWDLTERCLPDGVATERLSEVEVVRRAAQKSLRALGVARPDQIKAHFTRDRYPNLDEVLRDLTAEGRLVPVEIGEASQNWPGPWYVHIDDLPLLDQLSTEPEAWPLRTTLLSPFDNLICDRQRTELFFNFNYRSEIYVPKAKRQYGYYVMPILHGDQLIGRLDPKLERQQARLSINAVYFEPDMPLTAGVASSVVQAINELGDFVGASEIVYGEPVPPLLRRL